MAKEESLEERFIRNFEGVRIYAEEHSHESYHEKNFEAYRALVSIGADVLPYLKTRIGNEDITRWYVLLVTYDILRQTSGRFRIPKDIRGNLPKMEKHLLDYLTRKGC